MSFTYFTAGCSGLGGEREEGKKKKKSMGKYNSIEHENAAIPVLYFSNPL